jgi:dTDP-4-amino-4,6-dideoxygalactose transaminase
MDERASAAFTAFCGTRFAVGFDHGSSALLAALLALGIGHGDEVVVPALNWVACGSAVIRAGAIPVFVDVSATTLCIEPSKIEEVLGPRTKAIIAAHLYGSMIDMETVGRIADVHHLSIVEDASHVHGSRWSGRSAGSLGRIGVFSFQQGKQIATGEGGMAVTNDAALASRLEQIRADGRRLGTGPIGQQHLVEVGEVQGFNLCPSELHSALLIDALERFSAEDGARQGSITVLDEYLHQSDTWGAQRGYERNTHRTYYHYLVRIRDPGRFPCRYSVIGDALSAELQAPVATPYPPISQSPLFRPDASPAFRWYGQSASLRSGRHAEAERATQEALLLHHSLLLGNAPAKIVEALEKVARHASALQAAQGT